MLGLCCWFLLGGRCRGGQAGGGHAGGGHQRCVCGRVDSCVAHGLGVGRLGLATSCGRPGGERGYGAAMSDITRGCCSMFFLWAGTRAHGRPCWWYHWRRLSKWAPFLADPPSWGSGAGVLPVPYSIPCAGLALGTPRGGLAGAGCHGREPRLGAAGGW